MRYRLSHYIKLRVYSQCTGIVTHEDVMIDVKNNLNSVKKRILESEKHTGKKPGSVFLLGASKSQSVEKIEQAIAAGQFAFGENYLQEALIKMTALSGHPIEWHFIGPVQSNKAKKIAENFSWVQTVSDIQTAKH